MQRMAPVMFLALLATVPVHAAPAKQPAPAAIGRIAPLTFQKYSDEHFDLGGLADGLRAYLALDRSLQSLDPAGLEAEADFSRGSVAFLPDLTPVAKEAPRFTAGRFGQGILIEYGHYLAGKNVLPDATAGAERAPEGFAAMAGARLSRAPGLQGAGALKVEADAAGAGFRTAPAPAPLTNCHTFSLYVKGAKGQELSLAVRQEGDEKPLAEKTVTLSGEWQRAGLDYAVAPKPIPWHVVPTETTRPLSLEATLRQPGSFLADALMLEAHAGYGGRRGLSTWMPGGKVRAGEILSLPAPPNLDAGTLAFWAAPRGDMGWRCLLCIDNGVGWWPDLRVDLYGQNRVELVLRDNKVARKGLPKPIPEGEWHHFVVTWRGPEAILYLDGEAFLTVPDAPARERMGRVNLGGVANNTSPAVRADAVFDELAEWDRSLAPEEVKALFGRPAPLSAGMDAAVTVLDREPVKVFARDDRRREWHLRLANRSGAPLAGVAVAYGIPGVFERKAALVPIPPASACEMALPWSPALLEPGAYTMRFAFSGGPGAGQTGQTAPTGRTGALTQHATRFTLHASRFTLHASRPIEVVAARPPARNAQVITWGGNGKDLAPLGITAGGGWAGPPAHEVEESTRNRLYSMVKEFFSGEADADADRFRDVAGNPAEPDQRRPGPLKDAEEKAERLAARLARYPDVRILIPNSEHQWIWSMDFRPETVALARKRFGLDLSPWMAFPAQESWAVVHPMARLSAAKAKHAPPPDGILPENDPFYTFHRWWHSDAVGNEIFLNDLIARKVRARAPWVQSIAEPALRRPAVRAFKAQDVIEEWFYYPSPLTAVWVQETLAAAARGTNARITGMPQFLFKPGMAAPYGGMPTPHLFRETVWHSIARPLMGLTYWNLWGALKPEAKNQITQEEIDKRMGPTPTWETAKAKTEVKGEWSDTFLFIPELGEEIGRMHREVVHPLGALLPRWRNRPRQLAVYRSFAGQLFNEVRWPGGDPLTAAVGSLGAPFDVLYDEDFAEDPRALEGYRALALPECAVLTAPAAKQIRAFLARGGVVVADDYLRAKMDGIVQLRWQGANEDLSALRKLEQDLLKQYGRPDHPAYVEAMEQAAKEKSVAEGPTAKAVAALAAALSPEVATRARHVCTNLLQAEGANYLAAVNDLRVPGRYYGHFGRVQDEGVAQSADFEADPRLGKTAYDLIAGQEVPLQTRGGRATFRLDLPPAGGRVLVFLPEPFARVGLGLGAGETPGRGSFLALQGRLLGASGRPVPGILPARITVTGPDGAASDHSHYTAFTRGAWSFSLPIAVNAPAGAYQVEVTELASGKKQAVRWSLAAKKMQMHAPRS